MATIGALHVSSTVGRTLFDVCHCYINCSLHGFSVDVGLCKLLLGYKALQLIWVQARHCYVICCRALQWTWVQASHCSVVHCRSLQWKPVQGKAISCCSLQGFAIDASSDKALLCYSLQVFAIDASSDKAILCCSLQGFAMDVSSGKALLSCSLQVFAMKASSRQGSILLFIAGLCNGREFRQGTGRVTGCCSHSRQSILQHNAAYPDNSLYDASRLLLQRNVSSSRVLPLRPGNTHLHSLHLTNQTVSIGSLRVCKCRYVKCIK